MIKIVDNYICDECGRDSTNKYDFRSFIGNVCVGKEDYTEKSNISLIGENIRTTLEEGYRSPVRGNRDSIMVYSNHYCLSCVLSKLGISMDNTGKGINTLDTLKKEE